MADSKYFTTTKRGEIHELKEELASLDKYKKKDAVKKVIAAMTVGKDVSMLFPFVVNCMQTEDLELKKLVYLYLINYAKTQPDLAIMAVNTFVKDSQDPNPLIRALAVRTMGCIRVDKITEYLCDPLQRCLKDEDPYVRKTAAVCVAKLFDINAELVEDRGFLDMLRELLSDANPMVVANAVAALAEVQELGGRGALKLSSAMTLKLLAALNECTEWGQVFILDSIAEADVHDAREAEKVVERVLPRLQHVNSAVVLSAVKVVLKMMDLVTNEELIKTWSRKMAPPLVTLLSAEPEVQYVGLRNINLVVQRRPEILAHEVKVFFCKYNDPLYVKMEKLEILIALANDRNIDQVLLEFKEYAQEVDVDFVRKSVRAIGRCAVALEAAAERCINVLLELIRSKVNYVVQEAVIVIKDIFRRYPNRYESIIATLCDALDTLDEPEAKASMIWIVGQYAERIDNADDLLESFLESFPEETSMVQLQLLTATVKLFLKKPSEAAQRMIQLVLSAATQETDNPDLRDRAYIYWRLLSTDPEAARDVVLAEKPVISDDSSHLEPGLLKALMAQIGSLASVYHRPAETFVSRTRLAVHKAEELVTPSFLQDEGGASGGGAAPPADNGTHARAAPAPVAPPPAVDLLGGDLLGSPAKAQAPTPAAPAATGIDDLLGGLSLGAPAAPTPTTAAPVPPTADPFDLLGGAPVAPPPSATSAAPPPGQPLLLPPERGSGVSVYGGLVRSNGTITYRLTVVNGTAGPVDGLMLQVNNNAFGLALTSQVLPLPLLAPGAQGSAEVTLTHSPSKQAPPGSVPLQQLQVAMKTHQLGVLYWEDSIPLAALLEEDGTITGNTFLASWRALSDEAVQKLPLAVSDVEATKARLAAINLFVLAHRPVPATGQEALYITGRVAFRGQVLLELRFVRGAPGLEACFKAQQPELAPLVFDAVTRALQ